MCGFFLRGVKELILIQEGTVWVGGWWGAVQRWAGGGGTWLEKEGTVLVPGEGAWVFCEGAGGGMGMGYREGCIPLVCEKRCCQAEDM